MQYRAISEGIGEYNADIPSIVTEKRMVLVCKSKLERECLYNSLGMTGLRLPVICYETIAQCEADGAYDAAAVLLLHTGTRKITDTDVSEEISTIRSDWDPVPIILLSELDEWAQVVHAIELGARGFIPTSVGIKICVEAVHLAIAGGTFIPASSIGRNMGSENDKVRELSGIFTSREIQVIQLLRQGKANKMIAYDLAMSEATVKVHVHNIMKKMGATNRTEVTYKLNTLHNNVFL